MAPKKPNKVSKTKKVTPEVELTEEEKLEIELGEQARIASDSWDSVKPGKAADFKASFGRMIGLLGPYKPALFAVVLLSVASVALTIWAPRIFGRATDLVFSGFVSRQFPPGVTAEQAILGLRAAGQERLADMVAAMPNLTPGVGIDFTALRNTLLMLLGIYAIAALLSWAQGFIINIIMVKAMWRLRENVEAKINRLPLAYFDQTPRGDLISRVTNDIENITSTMQQSISGVITAVLTLVGVIAMMFHMSWRLALLALIVLPIMGVVFGVIGPKSQKAFGVQWRKVGRLNARVEESFSGHALVKTFGRRQDFQNNFAKDNADLYDASFKAQFLSGIMMPAMFIVGNLQFIAIAIAGGLSVANGAMTLGGLQAFMQYTQMSMDPMAQLGSMIATVQSGTASAERVFELLDADEQTPDAATVPAVEPVETIGAAPTPVNPPAKGNNEGNIAFQNVKFAYEPEKPLIEDLSFQVHPGQTVAIVGPTGAGKTTLVNLLMRFYELDGGAILIDGVNTSDLTRGELRDKTGMVLQDTWLFAGTIMENIRYGRQDATDAEVIAAAKATYVDRFVHSLPDGYQTVLEEDAANLSAGERQLITIARAFLSDPQILILDEATSSVDTRTEKLLQSAMAKLRHGRTAFVIAHRLSTIRDADLILVMEQGDIVEQGDHETLIAKDGAYARLYNSQFSGAFADEELAKA